MTRRRLATSVLAVVIAVAATGCGNYWPTKHAPKDVGVVSQYLQRDPGGMSLSFEAGPYKGGTGIVDQGGSAFWVKDGQGYVVNDNARKAAPALPQAPEDIKYDQAFLAATQNG